MLRKLSLISCLLVLSAINCGAQNVSVADVMKLPVNAGEGQSTVVPPGKKGGPCKAGRILVSNDLARPPFGVVSGQSLDNDDPAIINSVFNMGALAPHFDLDVTKSNYVFGTNDHDLVTLSNGDVLYITGAFSRMPLGGGRGSLPGVTLTPPWWKDTQREICTLYDAAKNCRKTYTFGPGARSVVLVWRSQDCGEHFDFVSEFDPARTGGGTCALPQFRRDANGNLITDKPYDMGGTDGQLAKVDLATDRVYMTFQCVGYMRLGNTGEFLLDSSKPIGQTLVAVADNEGASWKSLGYIKEAWWRFGIAPLPGGELAFGYDNAVTFGRKDTAGNYHFDSQGVPAPDPSVKLMWEGTFGAGNNVPLGSINANVWANPVIARTPDSQSVLVSYPAAFGNQGYGYHLYFYDQGNKKLGKANDIVPAIPGKDNFIFHLTAIDPGKGPILLYWYDFDSATRKATIRGRLITRSDEYSDDFVVSQAGGKPHTINLTSKDYWFGDYQTAGGYTTEHTQSVGTGKLRVLTGETATYDYYPMWVEPDGTVRYTKVEYSVHVDQLAILSPLNQPKPVKLHPLTQKQWRPQPPPVMLSQIRPSGGDREMNREKDMRRQ